MAKLTKTERHLLVEVDSCPDKTATLGALRAAFRRHLTDRGFTTVLNRMVDARLVGWTEDRSVALTWKGFRVLSDSLVGEA